MTAERTDEPQRSTSLELTADELELVRAALRLLQSTLGREEAEELHEVKALLARLGLPGAAGSAGS